MSSDRLPSYVAAFRTYTWDDDVAELARRFFAACPRGRQVVLADQTRGPLPIPAKYEVVGHTEDSAALGVPNHPRGQSLWYNVDYGVYFLRQALPGYEYYLLSESDLAVNLDLEPMVAGAAARAVDIATHDVRPADPAWVWYPHGTASYPETWRALLFFMLLSGSAIDRLLAERRRLAGEFAAGRLAAWPFCEPFVASFIKAAGFRVAEVSDHADTADLNFRPRLALSSPRANRPGSLAHSVLGDGPFARAVIGEAARPRDALYPGTDLHEALHPLALARYAPALKARLEKAGDHAAAVEIATRMRKAGLDVLHPDDAPDLAFCRPALSSSVSEWSHASTAPEDAAGANGVTRHEQYGFHTAEENAPWWLVDLQRRCVVEEVRITNRPGLEHRFVRFAIDSSADGQVWTQRFVKLDLTPVSGDAAHPWTLRIAEPFTARFVRVRQLGWDVLHLRRVELFGHALEPTPAAAG